MLGPAGELRVGRTTTIRVAEEARATVSSSQSCITRMSSFFCLVESNDDKQ